jgi:steroid delta-isomerase-like uncharacterized protein
MGRVRALLFLLFAPALAALAAAAPASSVAVNEQERNKAVAARVFEEIFNQGRFEAADEIYAPDFINHGLHHDAGLKQDQAAAQWEKTVCPDLHMSILQSLAEGDKVTVVWIARGTQTARLGWLPPTGALVELRGISVWRIADGRIHDEWTAFDMLGVVRQVIVQIKWQIIGALVVMLGLLWLVGRGLRKGWAAAIARNQ